MRLLATLVSITVVIDTSYSPVLRNPRHGSPRAQRLKDKPISNSDIASYAVIRLVTKNCREVKTMLKQLEVNTENFEELQKKEIVMQCHSVMFTGNKDKVKMDDSKKFFELKKKNIAKFSYIILLYAIYICKNDSYKKLYSRSNKVQLMTNIQDERTLRLLEKKKNNKFKEKLNCHYDRIKGWREQPKPFSWDKICKLLRQYYSRHYRGFVLSPSYLRRTYNRLKQEKELDIIDITPLPEIEVMPDEPDDNMDFDNLPDIEIMPIDTDS